MIAPSIIFDAIVCSMWCGCSKVAPRPAKLILSGLGFVLRRWWLGVVVRVRLVGRLCLRFSVLHQVLI